MTLPAPEGDVEELEAEIVREAWNTYDLEDGSRLRARSILTKVLWPKGFELLPGKEAKIGASINQLIVVFAPKRLKGPRNPEAPTVQEAAKMKQEEVGTVESKEEWSIYRLPGKRVGVKIKMVVSSVFRVVDVFNAEGDPYYLVNSTTVLGPTSPREIETP